MLKIGIDDAGRGPVIGPMILAGCLIEQDVLDEFRKLGVKDSKDLTPKKREFLAEKIRKSAKKIELEVIFPKEIDETNKSGLKLNELEAIACAKIINRLNDGSEKIKVFVDCPSPSILKWQDYLKTHVENLSNLEISCEHKADRNHVEVSAASILAKSERERQMDLIKKKYGAEIGSGYPSDYNTIRFLEKYAIKYKDDGIFRLSWETWQKARDKLKQLTLGL